MIANKFRVTTTEDSDGHAIRVVLVVVEPEGEVHHYLSPLDAFSLANSLLSRGMFCEMQQMDRLVEALYDVRKLARDDLATDSRADIIQRINRVLVDDDD